MKLKYYYTFKSIKNNTYRVEILEDTTVDITAKEIDYAAVGFTVNYSDVDNKLETTIGSGAKFTVIAKKTFDYIDLYTANIQQFQVRLLKDNAIIWSGWLDTEYYQEDFSINTNIDIDLTAADFNVLERIQYLKPDGSTYEGITSFFDILKTVVQKLGLPFTNMYIASSITSNEFSIGTNETILHKVFAINRNYYDEDYKALDCRKVLEGILKPFNLSIKQVNNELFIYDIETLLTANSIFKRYNTTTFSFIDSVIVNCNQGDLSNIKTTSNSSTYSNIGSYNKLKLTYSTFKESVLGDGSFDVNTTTELSTSNITTDVRSGKDYSFKTDIYNGVNALSLYNQTSVKFRPTILTPTGEYVQTENTVKGIALNNFESGSKGIGIEFKKKLPVLINETGRYGLKIDASLLLLTVDNYFADGKTTTAKERGTQALVPFKLYLIEKSEIEILSSGTPCSKNTIRSYDNLSVLEKGSGAKWVQEIKYGDEYPLTYSKLQFCSWGLQSSIANTWVNCQPILYAYNYTGERPKPLTSSFVIPLPAGSYGELHFSINDGIEVFNAFGVGVVANLSIKKVLIDNIKLTIVDSVTGDEVALTDVEYNSYINKNYKDNADDIEVIQGINSEKYPNENGSILIRNTTTSSYSFANAFTKSRATDVLEKLNLRTFISNYKNKSASLTCQINNTIRPLGYVTYSKYLSSVNLGLYGYEVNYEDETIDINTKEILNDTININSIIYEPN